MKTFYQLLANALISSVMTSFLWFALIFWVYLETESVMTTSVVGGAFALFSALFAMAFGTFVDRHRKRTSLLVSAAGTLALYGFAGLMYVLVDQASLLSLGSAWFWLFVALILAGSVVGNLRAIAMSTIVTLLVPPDRRDRANGMVGTVMGLSFSITSVLSGLAIGQLGMGWAIAFALALTAVAFVHLLTVQIPGDEPAPLSEHDDKASAVDFRGAIAAIRDVPGLYGLVFFAAFNNLLGGVFMALMDAYGLELMSVEAWGILFAGISFGFIAGGLYVARRGLGSRPMRVILIVNFVNWTICSLFTLQSSIVTLAIGMLIWMTLMPLVEAAEQTVLQQVVPFEKQGRVFGFAQTVENAASPFMSFLIGPIAQLAVIPLMTDGWGADAIGGWFGTGKERGLALIFTVAGIIGIIGTLAARRSRWYHHLSAVTDSRERPTPTAGSGNAGSGNEAFLYQSSDAGTVG
jgi:DHA3 family multidrug efflux protein-like MFS transporter